MGIGRVQAALVVGVVLLVALIVHEGRVRQPILPLRLFYGRERSGAYTARLLYLGAMILESFGANPVLQVRDGRSGFVGLWG